MCTTQNCGFAATGHCTNAKQEAFARDAASRTGHSSSNSNSYNYGCEAQNYEYAPQSSRSAYSQAQTPDAHSWMTVTIIEDDDLMFGGKPLSTWYEEDRRCSMGDEYASSPTSSVDEEELHRGRQRDRPQYEYTAQHHHHHRHHHTHKKSDSSSSESDEDKKQH